MLKFLTSLKQKDLSALSGEQILKSAPITINDQTIHLEAIDRYQLFNIQTHSNSNQDSLVDIIRDSYIFSNPNKHHLFIDDTIHTLSKELLYIEVLRNHPHHLTSKADQLQRIMPEIEIKSIHESDIWGFKLSETIDPSTYQTILEQWIYSTKDTQGLFCHPLIHSATPRSFENLIDYLNDPSN